jgi:hypothetical protein
MRGDRGKDVKKKRKRESRAEREGKRGREEGDIGSGVGGDREWSSGWSGGVRGFKGSEDNGEIVFELWVIVLLVNMEGKGENGEHSSARTIWGAEEREQRPEREKLELV